MEPLVNENSVWPFNKYSKNIAVITESSEEFTYENLQYESNFLANKLNRRRLAICLCRNSIESLLGYITFLNAEVVPLMVDASIESGLLNELIDTYKPSYIWSPSELNNKLIKFVNTHSWRDYSLFEATNQMSHPLFKDLALLMTTSGSTGSKKLVRQSIHNIHSNARSIIEYLELNESQRAITTLPMYYSYGLSVINSHLLCGASIIMTEKSVMTKDFWTLFSQFKATSIAGVPYTYELLDRLRFYKMELPNLQILTQAGGRLDVRLQEKLADYAECARKKFYVMYGQTEATARIAYLPPQYAKSKNGSIGIAIPQGELKLLDKNGIEINNPDQEGELLYSGPNVALGYAESINDLALGDKFKGNLLTGDIAKKDRDGFFSIVGRKSRFIKVYGNRINLDELESLIKDRLNTSQIACSGIDDKIHLYFTDNFIAKDLLIVATTLTGLSHFAFSIKKIDFIPKNNSGKTQYALLLG